jgi:uncharacterized protein (DUF952 family)
MLDMTDVQDYLHLAPVDVWNRYAHADHYVPDAYEADGFIHLTIGEANLMEVANLFYKDDPRDYLVLTLDQSKIAAPVQFDDDSGRYPHVYGHLNTNAVVAVSAVRRAVDGTFLGLERD